VTRFSEAAATSRTGFEHTFRREFVDPVADAADDAATAGGSIFAMGSPVTADDPARAAGSDSKGEGTGNAARGAVQGAGEIANLPQYGVTAIEAGEVGRAFVESSPAVEGGRDGLDEFADDAIFAGQRTASNVAEQATDNPAEFGGELIGGAVVGSGAATAARRALGSSSAAGSSVDVDTGAGSGSNLGTGGTGSLLDADALDEAQGVTGPSRRSRAAGRVQRSDTLQGIRDTFRQFRADESAQLRGRQRQRDTGGNDRVDDRFRGFESEVRRSALEQREFTDFQDLDRGGINDRSGRGARTRAEAENADRPGPRRRQQQAQRSEVLVEDDALDFAGGLAGVGVGSGVGVGVGTALDAGADSATRPGVDEAQATIPGVDVGADFDFGFRTRARPRGEQRTDTDGQTRTRTRPRTRTAQRTAARERTVERVTPALRLPGDGDSRVRPRLDDDSDNQQAERGLLSFGAGGAGGDTDGAATGFIAETLVGLGEGGLDVEAASATGSSDRGFLATRAQADNSEGFQAAADLLGVGEGDRGDSEDVLQF